MEKVALARIKDMEQELATKRDELRASTTDQK